MRTYELFIDELGTTNPLDEHSHVYVLCGCAVEKEVRPELKIRADQIKFKYWNKTDIVFHSRDIGKNQNDFAMFAKDKKLKDEFLHDLLIFLNEFPLSVFVIVVDKQKARIKGWNSIKIIKETSRKLFYHFLTWLLGLTDAKGKIIVESATAEKDRYYLSEFSYFLSPGCSELSVGHKLIQSLLTSLSFVTKRNHDIEEQVADIFAYAASCKHFRASKEKTFKVGTYEDKIIKILDRKLFRKPKSAREKKMKFYQSIDPFCILPKT